VEPWLVVWLIVAITTTVALVVIVASLVRQVVLLGRTASRLQRELSPIADEVAAASARAADTAATLSSRASPSGPVRRTTHR
jgi:heme exporter protein D